MARARPAVFNVPEASMETRTSMASAVDSTRTQEVENAVSKALAQRTEPRTQQG